MTATALRPLPTLPSYESIRDIERSCRESLERMASELRSGRVEVLDDYARAGVAPAGGDLVLAAERLLQTGQIPYALTLYQRAQASPDRRKLAAAVAQQERAGVFHPEVYDFLMSEIAANTRVP